MSGKDSDGKASNVDSSAEQEVSYHAYIALAEPGDSGVAWVLFKNQVAVKEGFLRKEGTDINLDEFTDALENIKDGFVVAYKLSQATFEWIMERMSTEESKERWQTANKCVLHYLYKQLLIDDDLYKALSLDELHELVSSVSRGKQEPLPKRNEAQLVAFDAVRKVGDIFYWLVTHRDAEYLKDFFKPGQLCRSNTFSFFRHDKKKRANRHWNTITEASLAQETSSTDVKYVVVDVETHDWLNGQQYTRQNYIGRIVEIAWVAFDSRGEEVERKSYLLQPHGGYTRISDKARSFHGITTRCVHENGCEARLVFARFVQTIRQIPKDGFVIAHNMRHEDCAMATNLMDEEALAIWDAAPKCCTWDARLLPLVFGDRFQNRIVGLKLCELYRLVSPDGVLVFKAHDALADARMTWVAFSHMKRTLEGKGMAAWNVLQWRPPKPMQRLVGQRRRFGEISGHFLSDYQQSTKHRT